MVDGSTRTRSSICFCNACSSRVRTSSPANAQLNSLTFSGSMPASHASCSSPGVPSGATPTSQTARTTRSGRSAAHASECGPPPDPPVTPKRSKPSSSASARTSATSSTTRRPWFRSDLPYPARSCVTKHTPSSAYNSSRGHRPRRQPGVPCKPRIGNPSGSPQTANASVRPSGVSASAAARPPIEHRPSGSGLKVNFGSTPSFRRGTRRDAEPSGTAAEPLPGRPARLGFAPGTGCVPPASRPDRAEGRARVAGR